ncbi:MAG: hypothetical protein H0W43_14520, partial [Chthoniobacterales bacterium]|nr:hypothetical protein [Chthoniobacterales bacterium]
RRELEDAKKEFENLLANELPKLNEQLKTKGQPEIAPPPAKVAFDESESGTGGGIGSGAINRDSPSSAVSLPANFRLVR